MGLCLTVTLVIGLSKALAGVLDTELSCQRTTSSGLLDAANGNRHRDISCVIQRYIYQAIATPLIYASALWDLDYCVPPHGRPQMRFQGRTHQ